MNLKCIICNFTIKKHPLKESVRKKLPADREIAQSKTGS